MFQMQDVLALDNEARMNTPGKAVGNWAWRMGDATIWPMLKSSALRLYHMNKLYDRYVDGVSWGSKGFSTTVTARHGVYLLSCACQVAQGGGAPTQGTTARALAIDTAGN